MLSRETFPQLREAHAQFRAADILLLHGLQGVILLLFGKDQFFGRGLDFSRLFLQFLVHLLLLLAQDFDFTAAVEEARFAVLTPAARE